eukprot:967916-Pyramimonas_sp.AAC.1
MQLSLCHLCVAAYHVFRESFTLPDAVLEECSRLSLSLAVPWSLPAQQLDVLDQLLHSPTRV